MSEAGLPAISEELRRFCDDVDRLIEECMIDGSERQKVEELRRAKSLVEQVLVLISVR